MHVLFLQRFSDGPSDVVVSSERTLGVPGSQRSPKTHHDQVAIADVLFLVILILFC